MNILIATIVVTLALCIMFVRNTKPDRSKKLTVVHRSYDDDETLGL